jgi:Cu-Zn family superoxide dismutase
MEGGSQPRVAVAVFDDKKIKGTVVFTEILSEGRVAIDIQLEGLKKNFKHGFHVHQAGDLREKCKSMCAHFNPYNKTHGCPGMKKRHVGDLGNLETNAEGKANYKIYDDVIKLHGGSSIIGRGLIIHEDTDDCGKGDNEETLITGNAGKRIACSIIGWAKDNFNC